MSFMDKDAWELSKRALTLNPSKFWTLVEPSHSGDVITSFTREGIEPYIRYTFTSTAARRQELADMGVSLLTLEQYRQARSEEQSRT